MALPAARYLRAVDADELSVLCVSTPDAVRVPCALIVGDGTPLPPAGAHGVVGEGLLAIGGLGYRVSRWWRPPRAPVLDGVTPAALRDAAVVLDAAGRAVQPSWDAAVARLAAAVRRGDTVGLPDAVAGLLGRGDGTTPFGDDVLAGALVTLHAVDPAAAARLCDAVREAAGCWGTATNTVSAALLASAARGECVPQLAAVLGAVASGVPLTEPLTALLGLGHHSGAGLAWGVATALAATTPDDLALGRSGTGSARVRG
jgi:hypothetical protein